MENAIQKKRNRSEFINVTSFTRQSILAYLLLWYIYEPFVWNILQNTFHIHSVIEYIFNTIIICCSIIIARKINKKIFYFLILFLITLLANYLVVDYKYYVMIEGIQALFGIFIPCFCIANKFFDLEIFLDKWYKFSLQNLILVAISVVLLKSNLVHYSIFTSICVPNVFIISYKVLQSENKSKLRMPIAMINILITGLLGGRMAAIVSVFMLLLAYVLSRKTKLWKKVLLIIATIFISFMIINYFQLIILWLNNCMKIFGIRSRSIELLITQLSSNEIYLTNRDSIYTLCIEYIKNRVGLPGGFGVPLYLTSGEYYYTHNIILQMFIIFGVPGTILLGMIMIIRAIKLKRKYSDKANKLLGFMFVSYLFIGMTGSSIWIHYLSTIFIALFFFSNNSLLIKRSKNVK